MKRSLQILFVAVTVLIGFEHAALAQNTYYWRGGTGNWNDPTKWSITQPIPAPLGTPSPVPTIDDDVVFDAGSFTSFSIVSATSINGYTTAAAKSITFSGTNTTINFQPGVPLNVAGAITVKSNSIKFWPSSPVTVGGDMTVNGTGFEFANLSPVTINGSILYSSVSANSNLYINSPLSVKGSLSVLSKTTVRVFNPLTIGGSLTFNPSMTLSTNSAGKLSLTSSSPATINSGGNRFDMPVTFNAGIGTDGKKGTWTLQEYDMTISNGVNFTNGHVIASPSITPPIEVLDPINGPKLVLTASASVTGSSNASHVIGYVQKVMAAKGIFTFPTGDGTTYRRIGIDINSNGTYTAAYFNQSPVPPVPTTIRNNSTLNSVSNAEFWFLGRADGSANAKVTLDYNNPDPAVQEYYNMSRWMGLTVAGLQGNKNNAEWYDLVAANADWQNKLLTATSAASSSTAWFTIGRRGTTPLPVRLVSFTAQLQNGQVQLKWQTASEENTSHFVVEKSFDGQTFEPVLTKAAQGNSNGVVLYDAVDVNPVAGTAYYRLKMVDRDGSFAYSKLAAVTAEGSAAYSLKAYPNPSKGNSIHLVDENGASLRLVAVTDMFGKPVNYLVNNATADGVCVNFTQTLPAGFYVATLSATDRGEVLKVKFVVQ